MIDGTLIYSTLPGPLDNRLSGLQWTHVVIGLRDYYYEAAPPRVRFKMYLDAPCHLVKVPVIQYSEEQIDKMVEYAKSQLGRKYQWTGFFIPKCYGKTRGIYCSEYACNILRAGGVQIPFRAGYSPDTLLAAMEKLQ
jgi:hypothetical protein